MARTATDLQAKINTLREYFLSLSLAVNLGKTKVMVFRKGGNLEKGMAFYYGEEKIEIVTHYTYLGVPFSYKGVFSKAAKEFNQKGKAALAAVWQVCFRGRMRSFDSKFRLFSSISASCALYSSHVWALRYVENIEQLQHFFIKRTLGVRRTTPNYMLRLETGIAPLKAKILKQALLFLAKILRMSDDRYPKMCLEAIRINAEEDSDIRYNWLNQLKSLLASVGSELDCMTLDAGKVLAGIPEVMNKVLQEQRRADIERVKNSATYSFYEELIPQQFVTAEYIGLNMPHKYTSIIAQCRLNNGHFYHNKLKLSLEPDNICTYCGGESDSFQHLLFNCSIVSGQRNKWLAHAFNDVGGEWTKVLKCETLQKCQGMFNFITYAIKYRNFIDVESQEVS